MKNALSKLFFICTLLCLFNDQANSQNTKTAFSGIIDSSKYAIDSVFSPVTIDSKHYTIIIAKDRYDEKHVRYPESELYFSPITIFIYNNDVSKIVFTEKYEENELYFYLNLKKDSLADDLFYLGMISFAGGSGYIGTFYSITFNDTPKVNLLFQFSELSHIAIEISGKEFIHIQGVWNFDENEAHFSNHRYNIFKHYIDGGKVTTKKLGKTKFKYSCFDEDMPVDEIFKDIFSKEPKLMKNIDLTKYVYGI
jgi:hypothetical protein